MVTAAGGGRERERFKEEIGLPSISTSKLSAAFPSLPSTLLFEVQIRDPPAALFASPPQKKVFLRREGNFSRFHAPVAEGRPAEFFFFFPLFCGTRMGQKEEEEERSYFRFPFCHFCPPLLQKKTPRGVKEGKYGLPVRGKPFCSKIWVENSPNKYFSTKSIV